MMVKLVPVPKKSLVAPVPVFTQEETPLRKPAIELHRAASLMLLKKCVLIHWLIVIPVIGANQNNCFYFLS